MIAVSLHHAVMWQGSFYQHKQAGQKWLDVWGHINNSSQGYYINKYGGKTETSELHTVYAGWR